MRPELERIKQRIRHGDISQDVLDALAKAVPTDSDFEEVMGGAPSDLDSFKEVASRIQHLEAIIKPKLGEPAHTVRFIDYDGTIISEVDLDDLPLKTMPQAPDHSNDFVPLTFTGWTTTLEKINSTKHFLDVGAQYKASDGNMHLVINITEEDIESGDNVFEINFKPVSEDIVIDWGNEETATIPAFVPESDEEPEPIARSATYSEAGKYDITITSDAENMPLWFDVLQSGNKVQECVIGSNVKDIQDVFSSCYSMQSLVIPDNVKTIGDYAFGGCNSLHCLVIPNSVTSIGIDLDVDISGTFYNCNSLHSLVIPDSVTYIGIYSFDECTTLSRLVIPDSVTDMENSVFYQCYSLESLYIGDGVTIIGNNAFHECFILNDLTIGRSVTSFGQYAFYCCYSLQNLVFPDNVTSINNYSFYDCYSLKRLVISANVTEIGSYAFSYCYNLSDLDIREGVTSIRSKAFAYCYSLQNLVIPDSVTSIGSSAFESCYSLHNLTIGSGVTSIDSGAFINCISLQNLIISDGLTNIESGAFQSCYMLQNLVLPSSIREISQNVFRCCNSLRSLVLPDGVVRVGSGSFQGSLLQSLVIPGSLKSIEPNVFNSSLLLKNLTISEGVTGIYDAFKKCVSLKNLEIPDSVQTIANDAFSNCYSLNNIVIGEGVKTIASAAFQNIKRAKVSIIQAPGSFTLPTAFADSSICNVEWGCGMEIVGYEVENEFIFSGQDTPIRIAHVYKRDLEEGDIVLLEGNYSITCSDNATITDGLIRPLVNSGTVTVTVTANDDSGFSVTKELDIVTPSATVELNNGQWVATEETVDGNTVYKSDAGSYHINNGLSRCTITVFGYGKLNIWAKADAEANYDYVVVGKLNQTAYRSSYKSRIMSNTYTKVTYDLEKESESTVDIVYTKNSSTNSNADRGFFYFTVE